MNARETRSGNSLTVAFVALVRRMQENPFGELREFADRSHDGDGTRGLPHGIAYLRASAADAMCVQRAARRAIATAAHCTAGPSHASAAAAASAAA